MKMKVRCVTKPDESGELALKHRQFSYTLLRIVYVYTRSIQAYVHTPLSLFLPFFLLGLLSDMRVFIHRRRSQNHVRWENWWYYLVPSCISFLQTHVYVYANHVLSLFVGFLVSPQSSLSWFFFLSNHTPFPVFFLRIGIARLPISLVTPKRQTQQLTFSRAVSAVSDSRPFWQRLLTALIFFFIVETPLIFSSSQNDAIL